MPDRAQGFYRNREGLRERDERLAGLYRSSQRAGEARFEEDVQRRLIDCLVEAASRLGVALHAAATDPCHLHLLVSWGDDRAPERIQRSLKWALTRRLNAEAGRRPWFTRQGHDRRVRDPEHFLHLRDEYLPSHRGWKWDRRRGLYR